MRIPDPTAITWTFVIGLTSSNSIPVILSARAPHARRETVSILSSPLGIAASIQVVRAFLRLRLLLASHEELSRKLEALKKMYAAMTVNDKMRAWISPFA